MAAAKSALGAKPASKALKIALTFDDYDDFFFPSVDPAVSSLCQGQTFPAFTAQATPSEGRPVVLVPLSLSPSDWKGDNAPDIHVVAEFLRSLTQLNVQVGNSVSLPKFIGCRNGPSGEKELKATDVANSLARNLPAGQAVYQTVALTTLGLFDTTSVSSFTPPDLPGCSVMSIPPRLDMKTICQTVGSALLAAMSLGGCPYLRCFLNPPKSSGEVKQVHSLCPVCLRKLSFCVGSSFDALKGYKTALSLYGKLGWDSEREWVEERISFIESQL